MKKSINTNLVARIENRFIFHAQYQLSAREQKVILYLISNMDPKKQSRFHEQVISVKELEIILKKGDDTKWGGLYEEMRDFTKRIRTKGIEFDTDVVIDGKKFPGYINWFQSVQPIRGENEEVCISFLFSEKLKPFLIDLNEYARINYLEAASLKSSYAIRMFQIFRATRNRMKQYEKISVLRYEIDQLKSILGIADKYGDFRNFRRRVLNPIFKEINDLTNLFLKKLEYERTGQKISHVIFRFGDIAGSEDKDAAFQHGDEYAPSAQEIALLPRARLLAFDNLVAYGVKPGIAYKQILPKIKGSEFQGFEDFFITEAVKLFEKKTKLNNPAAKAGAFVNWFLKYGIFEAGDMYAAITERVHERKKKLQNKNPQAWDNRLAARTMPAAAFDKMVRSGKTAKE